MHDLVFFAVAGPGDSSPGATPGVGMGGYATSKDDYLRRLRRIEGQIRGSAADD